MSNFNKTKVSYAVRELTEELSIDRSGDEAALDGNEEGWDDLNLLKDEIATTMLGFVIDTDSVVNNQQVLSMLGDKRAEFDKHISIFYSDIERFTSTIQTLRVEHENRSGRINTMEDLNTFTRLSMSYQTLQVEMQSLLGPTMASIILILHEVVPHSMSVEVPSDAVSDVEIKEDSNTLNNAAEAVHEA